MLAEQFEVQQAIQNGCRRVVSTSQAVLYISVTYKENRRALAVLPKKQPLQAGDFWLA
ncbi:hypothetical protein ALP71_00120 [Pseudomonas coronafaciens pv. garcae]|nr:hypothetical protein ALP71_00120 [Pseudomonas coronafaciens pv. garcae]